MEIAFQENNILRLPCLKLQNIIFAKCSQIPFKNLKPMFQK